MASVLTHSTLQPQVLTAVSQLSSLYNGLRTLSHSSGGHSHKKNQSAAEVSENKASATAQQPRATAEDLFLSSRLPEQLVSEGGLDSLPKDLPLRELCALVSHVKPCGHAESPWNQSYVSAQSFFENKTGLSRYLDPQMETNKAVLYLLRDSKVQRLFQRTLNSIALQQKRGFKTVRSERTTGLGRDQDNQTFLDELRTSLASKMFKQKSNPKTTSEFSHMVSQHDSHPEVQDKLKVAFAEGYHAKRKTEPDPKDSGYFKFGKIVVYAFFFWLGLQVFQAFSAVGGGAGPVGGLGVLRRERFEVSPEDIHVNFTDVKGVDEAKQELKDIVEFLKDPEKFTALGAKLPKGCLLVGPPGIGKTLLARAVAGEAGVPFFHASGSEFDEVFVGTGAKRVRKLFSAAKMRSPCVIFIDEIDSVGAKRTSSTIHPYANQTINQLLSEMDGFQQNEGVIVLGATNKLENLDQALLRPGRFDVEVRVFPPDMKGRKEILEHYVSKIKKDQGIDVEVLARGTTGFTGADLENLVNQAALKAAIDECTTVTMAHFDFARDKVLMGPAKTSKVMDDETNKVTAYHEAGHTLVAFFTKDAVPLHKVTIIARGQSLGHTAFMHEKEVYGKSLAQLKAELDVAMGGRAGEEIIFGQEKVTTGAGNDFQQATRIAKAMVKNFGMSEKVGMRFFEDRETDGGLAMLTVNDVSPAIQEQVDQEIKRLLQESYDRAKSILQRHNVEHKALAKALLHYETLDKDDIKAVVEAAARGSKHTKIDGRKSKSTTPVFPQPGNRGVY